MSSTGSRSSSDGVPQQGPSSSSWTCPVCTFAGNPALYLACSVCSTERSVQPVATNNNKSSSGSSCYNNNSNNRLGSSTNKIATITTTTTTASADGSRVVDSTVFRGRDMEDSRQKKSRQSCHETTTSAAPSASAAAEEEQDTDEAAVAEAAATESVEDMSRRPPQHVVAINNLSDRQFCCVWSVEVLEDKDAYRPDVARMLLAAVARHVNPILRERGWRVKRLLESCSTSWIGLCTSNGRNDADAASVNIQLNLRALPHRQCRQFRTFSQVLAVMLHEIAHTRIGLEDIHPPAFWELLQETKQQYKVLLAQGEVALETDAYGCDETVIVQGKVLTVRDAALQIDREQNLGIERAAAMSTATTASRSCGDEEQLAVVLLEGPDDAENCGASRRRKKWRRSRRPRLQNTSSSGTSKRKNPPLLKGAKMVDGRTKAGKAAKLAKENLTHRELAARAAMKRFGQSSDFSSFLMPTRPSSSSSSNAAANSTRTREDDRNNSNNNSVDDDDSEDHSNHTGSGDSDVDSFDEDDEVIAPHDTKCACRTCTWDKMLSHSQQVIVGKSEK